MKTLILVSLILASTAGQAATFSVTKGAMGTQAQVEEAVPTTRINSLEIKRGNLTINGSAGCELNARDLEANGTTAAQLATLLKDSNTHLTCHYPRMRHSGGSENPRSIKLEIRL